MNGFFKNNIPMIIFFYIIVAVTYSILDGVPLIKFIVILISICIPVMLYKDYQKDFRTKINSVNIPSYFDEMYQDVYNSNNIYLLEAMRKKARNKIIMLYAGGFISVVGIFSRNLLLMFIGLIIFLFGSNKKNERQYKLMYKKEILCEFIKSINEKLEYKNENIDSEMVKQIYKDADFDNRSFNLFTVDDCIEGVLEDNINMKMSDLHIQRKEVYYEEGKRRERIIEIFQGIFTQIQAEKDVGAHIKISKNKIKIFEQSDRVEMDSQEFEKYFDIYSENKILAMQLLTSDVMATLIDFYNRYNIEYEIVIRNNKIYMRFFTGAMFEPKIFGNSMDKRLLFSYYCILKFVVDITKEVNKALRDVEV